MNIIQTEYSFRKVFYHLKEAVQDSIVLGHDSVCIMDDNTFGFVKFEKICDELNVKPIYGLRVMMTDKKIKSRSMYESFEIAEEIYLIARSEKGISDLYEIYTKSTEQKYYFNRIYPSDIDDKDIIVISNYFPADYKTADICIPDFKYPQPSDIATYQCITGSRGVPTFPQYAQVDSELVGRFSQKQIDLKNEIGNLIPHVKIPKSGMIKYNGGLDFETECYKGLIAKGLEAKDEYVERLQYEIEMIKSKDFQDYFMIVSEMIKTAKKDMIVGPGRGSSGGSLVCYVLEITNVDPIKFGLIFERFIDINRSDFPDIDSDYPDRKRHLVLESIRERYQSVHQLGTIYTYKPKTVINDFAKEYKIPSFDLDEVKGSIIERSSGDARAQACLDDTFKGTKIGQEFLEKYPCMSATTRAEAHARHSGKHAAGIIVLDEPMTKYAAVDVEKEVVCIEGPDAESIGLLKIDCLGLRTLSVIENCLRLSGVDPNEIYTIDLEDPAVFAVFNDNDMSDIFQFDGDAIRMVNSRITVKRFSDLVAITALGRPGALNSGGTNKYIKINENEERPTYYGETYERITKPTNGIVVYQEQTMVLLREVGSLSWGDVNTMRKIISKSRGDEFFAKYKTKFIEGAINNGYTEEDANIIWDAIASMGSYAFNKSHAVAYAMISYWCAYCKLKYPLNFLAANLNNAKDDEHGLKMLRQYVKAHGIDYVPVDPDLSMEEWTIQDGVLIGGLTNINGIGHKKALDIIKRREKGLGFTKSVYKALMNPVTPYDVLYPMETTYKDLYNDNDITRIEDLSADKGTCVTIGKLTMKDLRDRNDLQSVMKRGGERVTENTHYLNLIIKDDTGSIKCTVAPFDMDRLNGFGLAETLALNDVVAIKGKIRQGWQTLSVQEIQKI